MSEPSSHDNEDRWIKRWADDDLYTAKPDLNKKKFFLTVAYPYPSGSMHVGHGRTYTVPDVIARFKRMQGFNVLFPMAWHVTGSPVLGIAERIKSQDPETLRIYGELYGVPKDKLELFTDPLNIVKYFSREYKQNIQDLTADEAMVTLKDLNPVKFNYKKTPDEENLGFIAEDVPDLVATKDRKGMSSMDVVAVLTKVVQEQQKTIAELTKKLDSLERMVKLERTPTLASVDVKK